MASNIRETDIFLEGDNLFNGGTLGGGESGAVYGETIFRGRQYVIQDVGETGSGYFSFGSSMLTVPTSPTTGTGVYIDYSGVYGNAGGVKQFYLNSADGKAYAGAGGVTLDVNGITLDAGTSAVTGSIIKWIKASNSNQVGQLFAYDNSGVYTGTFQVGENNSVNARVNLESWYNNAHKTTLYLDIGAATGYAALRGDGFLGLAIGAGIAFTPSSLLHLQSTAPTFRMEDTTAATRDMIFTVDGGIWTITNDLGTSLMTMDLTTGVVSSSGIAPGDAQYVTLATNVTLTNERVLTGTSNQITLTDNGAGSTVVLSTPQDIATISSPQFANLKLTNTGHIFPSADSTGAVRIANAAGTDYVYFDTSNSRVGIGGVPTVTLDVTGTIRGSADLNIIGSLQAKSTGAYYGTMDTMTYAGTISLDVTKGNVHETTTVNATGNATINASTAGVAGQHMWVIILNDATSGKTITFLTNFKASGTLSPGGAGKTATIHFISDGGTWLEVARTVGL